MAELVITLNVAKREGDEMVRNPYTCLACNKSFRNGQAFGGHKRIHFLKKKEKKPIEVIILDFSRENPWYYKCSTCRKTFRTESSFKKHQKSSFKEHQKTHLKRKKPKGTVEPSITASYTRPLSTTSSDVILVQDDPVKLENGEEHRLSDMSKFLTPGWSKTGKRSLVAGGLAQISTPEDVHQVANDLIVLSYGEARTEDLPLKKRKIELPPFEEMDYQHEETVLDHMRKGKGQAFVANSSGDIREVISGDFICQKCNRSFPTYQALGGHNSHHKRAVKKESRVRFPKSNGSSSSNLAERASARWPHKCSFCNKSFKTSQALSGHIRHKAPVPPAAVPLVEVAVEEIVEEAIVQVPKRAHLFDLNELPPPEDGDGIDDEDMVQPENSTPRLSWHEGVGDPGSSSTPSRGGELENNGSKSN